MTVRREALRGCLKKLPKVDRELIDRCYRSTDKLKLKDVAAERQCTPTALYKRLNSIRLRLFDCIQQKLQSEATSNG
jgi:DNA-directed RNA polymerase specialized sigma24 family protein